MMSTEFCRSNCSEVFFLGKDGCQASTPWGMGFQALLKLQHYTCCLSWTTQDQPPYSRPKTGQNLDTAYQTCQSKTPHENSTSQPFWDHPKNHRGRNLLRNSSTVPMIFAGYIWTLYGYTIYSYMDIIFIWIYDNHQTSACRPDPHFDHQALPPVMLLAQQNARAACHPGWFRAVTAFLGKTMHLSKKHGDLWNKDGDVYPSNISKMKI